MILAIIVLSIAFIAIKSTFVLAIALIILVLLSLNQFGVIFKRILPVNVFMIFVWLTLPFTVENGLHLTLLYTLRTNCIALLFTLFIAPLGVVNSAYAMQSMKVSAKLTSIIIFTSTYIYHFYDELQKRILAMNLRKPNNKMLTNWAGYAGVISSTIVYSIVKSDKIHKAMLCRGFTGTLIGYDYDKLALKDYLFLFATLLLSTVLLYISNI